MKYHKGYKDAFVSRLRKYLECEACCGMGEKQVDECIMCDAGLDYDDEELCDNCPFEDEYEECPDCDGSGWAPNIDEKLNEFIAFELEGEINLDHLHKRDKRYIREFLMILVEEKVLPTFKACELIEEFQLNK